jgi:hypothetical protein
VPSGGTVMAVQFLTHLLPARLQARRERIEGHLRVE